MAKKVRPEQVDLSQYYNKSESVPLIQGANITITESEEGVTISSSGGGGSSDWEDITNKPTTFTPSAHTHTFMEIPGMASTSQIPNLDANKITSGTFDIGRIPTGITSSTVSLGNHSHDEIDNALEIAAGNLIDISEVSGVITISTKIEVVEELPAIPIEGVVYFVKE